jgi:hypothetical protein
MKNVDLANLVLEIKLDLIAYYDGVKSEIDISAQEKLILIEKGLLEVDKRSKIVALNIDFIVIVEEYFKLNCKQIDEYFANHQDEIQIECDTKETIKMRALKHYCAFVELTKIFGDVSDEKLVGLLICSDWYLDENQIKFM